MVLSFKVVFLLLSAICFFIQAFASPKVNCDALGKAFLVLGLLAW